MNKVREILRLLLTTTLSSRRISRAVGGCSHNTIRRYHKIAKRNDFTWPDVEKLDDAELEVLIKTKRYRVTTKSMPDWSYIHRRMQYKFMTLRLLWEEYRMPDPDNSYGYSQFTVLYNRYRKKLDLSMRQRHRAGERVFVDYAGQTIPYVDSETGKTAYAQIFVGVLGCSNYTFAFASRSQGKFDWIDAHIRMLNFFGGVPEMIIPDNLKSAVTKAGKDLVLNRTYAEMARHYGCVIFPARVRKPQDKSKAELGVLIVSRWILARIRERKFFSVDEINIAIYEMLEMLNERPFKKLPGCRRSRFLDMDKPQLSPLPAEPFEYAEWIAERKVSSDYHMSVDNHYYSVPYELVSYKVETRVTKNSIDFIHRGRRVAAHPRSYVEGGNTTIPAHQPKEHRAYAELTPEKLIEWAEEVGQSALAAVQYQFESRPHALMGLSACSSLQKLAKEYGNEKFEAACHRAERIGSLSMTSIKSILKRRLVDFSDDQMPIQTNLPFHQNVRGSDYYNTRSPL